MGKRRAIRHYLKEWRKARGLTQMQLAELSGRSQGAITEYESGKSVMSIDAQVALAEALDIPPLSLFYPPDQISIDSLLAEASDDVRRQVETVVRALLDSAAQK